MDGEISYLAPQPRLYDGWRRLYGAYGQSVGDTVNEAIARTVWSWLYSGTHGLTAILAVSGRAGVTGFVHYRPFPRTLHGNEACFLDDLYVDVPYRGRGIGAELIRRVCDVATRRGWSEVRWVTTPDNDAARRVYERIAERYDLITYRVRLPESARMRR